MELEFIRAGKTIINLAHVSHVIKVTTEFGDSQTFLKVFFAGMKAYQQFEQTPENQWLFDWYDGITRENYERPLMLERLMQ